MMPRFARFHNRAHVEVADAKIDNTVMNRRLIDGMEVEWRIVADAVGVWVPVDCEALLDEHDEESFAASDEKMPYFASLWPTAARIIAKLDELPPLHGRTVLDLGCGVGAVGLAAAARGAEVSFLDWEQRALSLVAASAETSGLGKPRALVCADWRDDCGLEPFEFILASDVLYEPRNLEPVAAFVRRHLRPGGEAWVGDPDRGPARKFGEVAEQAGLEVSRDVADDRPLWRLRLTP